MIKMLKINRIMRKLIQTKDWFCRGDTPEK